MSGDRVCQICPSCKEIIFHQNNHQEFEKVLFTNLNLIKIFLEAEPVTYYELSFSYIALPT